MCVSVLSLLTPLPQVKFPDKSKTAHLQKTLSSLRTLKLIWQNTSSKLLLLLMNFVEVLSDCSFSNILFRDKSRRRVFCFICLYFPFVTLFHFCDACLANMETHQLQQGITLYLNVFFVMIRTDY